MWSIRKHITLALLSFIVCVGCSRQSDHIAGYIEGQYTYIASGVSGTLFALYVERGQPIKQGEPLYQLDPEPEKANVVISRANIADLEAQVDFAKVQLGRQQDLFHRNAAAKVDMDRAQTDYSSKLQQLNANKSNLVQSEWSLNQKNQFAPVSGQVFDTFYRVGEKVPLNQPVLALLAPENIKVLFYLPEGELSKLKLGQKISFTCDGCKEPTQATVSYISPEAEYTPPVIYSKDTRYKLVYLVRANMPPEIAKQFHPGQPIEVSLHP